MLNWNWDLIAALYDTTFTFFFFALAFLMFFISYKGTKAKNRYGATSTIVCGIFFIIFGFYNNIFGFLPFPFTGFIVWWIGIMLTINVIFAFLIHRTYGKLDKQKIMEKQMDSESDEPLLVSYIHKIKREDPYQEEISIKMEGIRKTFHLAGLLIVVAYYGFFLLPPLTQIVNDTIIVVINDTEPIYSMLWGELSNYPYSKQDFTAVVDLTIFALIGAMIFMIFSELIRVLCGPEYSIFNMLTKAVLRKKEYNAVGPQIYLITGSIFVYILYLLELLPAAIIFTAILVACFSDAIAALVGRRFGRHKVECIGGDIKSIEGFIAGTTLSYLIGLIFVGPLYALIGAVIFLILDYFPIIIADNILNPIFISIGIGLFYFLLGFPLGWVF